MPDIVEIIINWLQVSVEECNWRTSQTKILVCSRNLVNHNGDKRPGDLYNDFLLQQKALRQH
jgi:hypothetical protein